MDPVPQHDIRVSTVRQKNGDPDGRAAGRQQPRVTVVVCTRDRNSLLEACLDSLRRQTYSCFEILVVDNGTAYPARRLCARLGVRWVPAPVPGLTRARNIGARAANGELIAFIDDDSQVEQGWLDALVAVFADSGASAVCGRVRYMRANEDALGMSDEEAAGGRVRARACVDRHTPGWFALACFGGIGNGGNMAFRRELLSEGLQFEERIGRGRLIDSGDEHVLFATLIERGLRIAQAPEAVVRHPSPRTPRQQAERRYLDLRSSISHLLFVWGEFSAHRVDILRFLLSAVLRRVAPGARHDPARRAVALSRRRALMAVLGGARLYWLARAQWSDGRVAGSLEQRRPAPALMESNPGSR